MTNPTVYRDVCGTAKGFFKHRNERETKCGPCKAAWVRHQRAYKATPKQPRITTHEIAEEIRHLLSLGQGYGYIVPAVGYDSRLGSLEKRLRHHGYGDLYNALVEEPGAGQDPMSRRNLLRKPAETSAGS